MGLGTKCLIVTVTAWAIFKLISFDTEINYKDLLNNKNVIITGASSGIGEEAAKYCAEMGANVIIVARREHLLQQVVAKLHQLSPSSSPKIKYIIADLSDPNISQSIIEDAKKFFGSIDYLLLNHAFLPSTADHMRQWTGTEDQHKQLLQSMNTNFYSYVKLADHAVPHLKKTNGSLLVVSSMAVDNPAFTLPYSTSKSAINTFFAGLRQEFITTKTNVSVTIVHLGFVETEASFKSLHELASSTEKDLVTLLSMFPSSTQKEAGIAIINAMLTRETYFYHPSSHRLRLFRVIRNILRDPDYWMDLFMDYTTKAIKWKRHYIG